MNYQQRAKEILTSTGAVLRKDHFVYTSGRHGSKYVNKDAVFADPLYMEEMGQIFKALYPCSANQPQVILGPAVGGALLAQWVARAFSDEDMMFRHPVYAVYADKDGDQMVIKRGYDKLIVGKRVLVVEDIINSGVSTKKTLAAAWDCNAKILGVAAICNRGGLNAASFGVNVFYSLIDVDMKTYSPQDCPLCKAGTPVNTSIGHGKAFLERMGANI